MLAILKYVGPLIGSWELGANWERGAVPGPNDTAMIDRAGVTVTLSTGSHRVAEVVLTGANSRLNFSGGSLDISGIAAGFGDLEVGNTTALTINGGTLRMNSSSRLSVAGTLNLVGGTLLAPTSLTIGGGTFNISGGELTAPGSFSIGNGGTLTVTGGRMVAPLPTSFNIINGTFNFGGGFIDNRTAIVLVSSTLNIAPAATTPATFSMWNECRLSGNIAPGQTVRLEGGTGFGAPRLIVAPGTTNAGVIRIENSIGTNEISIPSGVLTNLPSGIIEAGVGVQGSSIQGTVVNQGTITAAASAILPISGGTFVAAGGVIQGRVAVVDSPVQVAESPPLGTETIVPLHGNCTLLGDNRVRTTLWVQGGRWGTGTQPVDATLTVPQRFTNVGTIRLESPWANAASNLIVSNGTLRNEGILEVNQGSGQGARFIQAELQNFGTVTVNTATTLGRTGAHNANTGVFRLTAGATLTLRGELTNNPEGVIEATGTLNFGAAGGGPFTNLGTLRVPPGTLNISGPFQNFDRFSRALTGGSYEVEGTWRFEEAAIVTNSSRLVLSSRGARIQSPSGTDALANFATNTEEGNFTIHNGADFQTGGTVTLFHNLGTVTVGAGSLLTVVHDYEQAPTATLNVDRGRMRVQERLRNFANGRLTGGTYRLEATAVTPAALQFTNAAITTNAATVVLSGARAVIVDQAENNALTNLATNTGDGSLTIQDGRSFTTAGPFSNAGALAIGPGSEFRVLGTYTQTAGRTILNGGTLTVGSAVDIRGGVLSGSGIVNGNVRNAGELAVGASGVVGLLTVNGSFVQTATGVLRVKLGEFASKQYDRLRINGTATLDGTLRVELLDRFFAQDGNLYEVLTYSSVSGQFAPILSPDIGASFFLAPRYESNRFTLRTTAR